MLVIEHPDDLRRRKYLHITALMAHLARKIHKFDFGRRASLAPFRLCIDYCHCITIVIVLRPLPLKLLAFRLDDGLLFLAVASLESVSTHIYWILRFCIPGVYEPILAAPGGSKYPRLVPRVAEQDPVTGCVE